MIYNKQYFIDMFSAIPEENWYVGEYSSEDNTKFCAYGHCGVRGDYPTYLSIQLRRLFSMGRVDFINDGYDYKYQQPTPKQRILAALNDLPD